MYGVFANIVLILRVHPRVRMLEETSPQKKERNEASQKVKATSGNQRVQKIIDAFSAVPVRKGVRFDPLTAGLHSWLILGGWDLIY